MSKAPDVGGDPARLPAPSLLEVVLASVNIMQVRITRSRMAGARPEVVDEHNSSGDVYADRGYPSAQRSQILEVPFRFDVAFPWLRRVILFYIWIVGWLNFLIISERS